MNIIDEDEEYRKRNLTENYENNSTKEDEFIEIEDV